MRYQDKIPLDVKELGLRIKRAREHIGMSQESLAVSVKLDQRAISELENGKRGMIVTELPIFADSLGVSITYFFGDDLSPTDLDNVLLKEFHRLPSDKLRKMAVDMIQLLSETLKNPSTN